MATESGTLASAWWRAQRAAERLQVGGDVVGQCAAIETVQAVVGQPLQGVCELRLIQQCAFVQWRAVGFEDVRVGTGLHAQLGPLAGGDVRTAQRHRHAGAGVVDGVLQQALQRQVAACVLQGQRPA